MNVEVPVMGPTEEHSRSREEEEAHARGARACRGAWDGARRGQGPKGTSAKGRRRVQGRKRTAFVTPCALK